MTPLFLTKTVNFRQKYSSLTHFLSQFVLCLTSNNSTSQNIGGTDARAVPPPQIWGTVPKSPPMPPIQFGYRLFLQRRNTREILENILNCPRLNVLGPLGSRDVDPSLANCQDPPLIALV